MGLRFANRMLKPRLNGEHVQAIGRARVSTPDGSSPRAASPRAWSWAFHLLRRAGYDEDLIGEVARVMEYQEANALYRDDVQVATPVSHAA